MWRLGRTPLAVAGIFCLLPRKALAPAVSPVNAVQHHFAIAGERRWRAAQLAQLHEIPVVIRELDDREALEIALVENIQRQDLTPLEEAEGYRRLMDDSSYTRKPSKISG